MKSLNRGLQHEPFYHYGVCTLSHFQEGHSELHTAHLQHQYLLQQHRLQQVPYSRHRQIFPWPYLFGFDLVHHELQPHSNFLLLILFQHDQRLA